MRTITVSYFPVQAKHIPDILEEAAIIPVFHGTPLHLTQGINPRKQHIFKGRGIRDPLGPEVGLQTEDMVRLIVVQPFRDRFVTVYFFFIGSSLDAPGSSSSSPCI